MPRPPSPGTGPSTDAHGDDPGADGARASIDPGADGPRASLDPGADGPRASAEAGGSVRLRPPRHQVDRRAIRLWTVHAVLAGGALAIGVIASAMAVDLSPGWLVATTLVAVAAAAAYAVVMPRVRYRVHRWEVTDDAVYTKAGWLTHEWRVAPLSRVQTVDARRGPLQQLLGLSSVRITTASAAGDVTVEGLDHVLAADLVEALTTRTQATPGDAT